MATSVQSGLGERESSSCASSPSAISTFSHPDPNDVKNAQAIAREAIYSYNRLPGFHLETPSVQSILAAYQKDGHGDRLLLLAILEAKKMEDERLAARDNFHAAKLRAQLFQGSYPTTAPGSSSSSTEPSLRDRVAFHPSPLPESEAAIRRKFPSPSASSTSPLLSTRSLKRARHSLDLSSPDKGATDNIKLGFKAKVARSSLSQSPTKPVSSLQPAMLASQKSYSRPNLSLDTDFRCDPSSTSHFPTPASTGEVQRPFSALASRPSPSPSAHTRAGSPLSLGTQSNPPSPPTSPLPAPSVTISATNSLTGSSIIGSSLARLLNGDSTGTSHR